jgi:hypothetical protein
MFSRPGLGTLNASFQYSNSMFDTISVLAKLFDAIAAPTLIITISVDEPEQHNFCGAGAGAAPTYRAPNSMLNMDRFRKNVTNFISFTLFLFILTTIAIIENH